MVFDQFKDIVRHNVDLMLLNYKPRRKKSSGSFSELLFNNFSQQSLNIRIGSVLEKSWKQLLFQINDVDVLDYDNIAGHQIDLMFIYRDDCFYLESKNNINLDTEKTLATYNKVKFMEKYLKDNFTKYNTYSKVLSNRYHSFQFMKHYKKPLDKDTLFGYGDFFLLFDEQVSIKNWETFFNNVGKHILEEVVF